MAKFMPIGGVVVVLAIAQLALTAFTLGILVGRDLH